MPEWCVPLRGHAFRGISVDASGHYVALADRRDIFLLPFSKPTDKLHRANRKPLLGDISVGLLEWCPLDANKYQIACATNTSVHIWNMKTPLTPVAWQAHERAVSGLAWSPVEPFTLATCSADCTTQIWDVRSQPTSQQQFRSPSSVLGVRWNTHNHNVLATAHTGGEVAVWDRRNTRTSCASVMAHTNTTGLLGLDWNRYNSKELTTCGQDNWIRFWDTSKDDLNVVGQIATPFPMNRLLHAPVGDCVLTTTNREVPAFWLWSPVSYRLEHEVTVPDCGSLRCVAFRHTESGSAYAVIWGSDDALRCMALPSPSPKTSTSASCASFGDLQDAAELPITPVGSAQIQFPQPGSAPAASSLTTPFASPPGAAGAPVAQAKHRTLQQEIDAVRLNLALVDVVSAEADLVTVTVRVPSEKLTEIGLPEGKGIRFGIKISFPRLYPNQAEPAYTFFNDQGEYRLCFSILRGFKEASVTVAGDRVQQHLPCLEESLHALEEEIYRFNFTKEVIVGPGYLDDSHALPQSLLSLRKLPARDKADLDRSPSMSSLDSGGHPSQLSAYVLEATAPRKRRDDCIPAPCGVAGFITQSGHFLFVTQPNLAPHSEPASPNTPVAASPRTYSEFKALRKASVDASAVLPVVSEPLLRRRAVSMPAISTGLAHSEDDDSAKAHQMSAVAAKVVVFTLPPALLGFDSALAKEYLADGPDIGEVCRTNAAAAAKAGREDINATWLALANVTDPSLLHAGFGAHPCGRPLVLNILRHYLARHDLQTLAMVTCVAALPHEHWLRVEQSSSNRPVPGDDLISRCSTPTLMPAAANNTTAQPPRSSDLDDVFDDIVGDAGLSPPFHVGYGVGIGMGMGMGLGVTSPSMPIAMPTPHPTPGLAGSYPSSLVSSGPSSHPPALYGTTPPLSQQLLAQMPQHNLHLTQPQAPLPPALQQPPRREKAQSLPRPDPLPLGAVERTQFYRSAVFNSEFSLQSLLDSASSQGEIPADTAEALQLLLPQYQPLFNRWRRMYAATLHRNGLQIRRAEVGKFITNERLSQRPFGSSSATLDTMDDTPSESAQFTCQVVFQPVVEPEKSPLSANTPVEPATQQPRSLFRRPTLTKRATPKLDTTNVHWDTPTRQSAAVAPTTPHSALSGLPAGAVICVICHLQVRGLCSMCASCGCAGHTKHLREWFSKSTRCPGGCACECSLEWTSDDFEGDSAAAC
eukprot:TRINITY_DN12918_c0_g1_i1.p1 TRINITY_DN12918_c0_g1~~TRINITY_DN12918_c0_g1_i1.p1  ORF type:complete len:1214 (-),score=135.99 TRINITY_DN12918_c0_g1_i1:221-3841(-)